MILTERDIYPLLEMDWKSEHKFAVELFFNEIKSFSLCWLAEEELELRYPDRKINRDLMYKRNGNAIEIYERKGRKVVAQIRYNPI